MLTAELVWETFKVTGSIAMYLLYRQLSLQ